MLNINYRLLTVIQALYIEEFLLDIISLDQTELIKHRQTHENVHRTLNIIQHLSEKTLEALIMAMDAEKLFYEMGFLF